jgi:phenylpyruvate tautomerase PptA (4-oxalocrotonate tautomerase family)
MPLTHIAIRAGKSEAYHQAIFDGLYQAMRETFNVAENSQFMTVTEHGAASFRYDPSYGGIERTDDLVLIQITANNTRTVEQKKALYRRITELLSKNPGIRPEDVFVNLVEVAKENWSFGNGLAQYA